jgi:[protein-PII] uridylyltransferase
MPNTDVTAVTTTPLNLEHAANELATLCQTLSQAGEHMPGYKAALAQGSERIYEHYLAKAPISQIIHLHTALVDNVLLGIWDAFFSAEQRGNMALVAVGGYGRGELHPNSDVDIMVLLRDAESRALNDDISGFITQLWDLGLDIGHSVRTVEECISESIDDLTVITNLIEARLLEGNAVLFQLMTEALQPENTWNSQDFFRAKMEEQANRRNRFHETAYRLEPNLKESPGGLRDIQTIGWISRRHFGTENLEELVDEGFISQEEYISLQEGQQLLWKIRYLLHHISGRREDRLLFDHQRDLAHQFGFTDDTENRSIEAFMQNYYRTVMNMQRLNEIILQKFQETLQEQSKPAVIEPINDRFQIRNGYLEVCDDGVFERHPEALLEIFQAYARSAQIKGVRANTIRLIRSNLDRIDHAFRDNPEARSLFMQIFRDPRKLTRKLRRMNRYGVMAAYLPDFANIVGRMQYDLFHIYTVDEHTTRVIRNLRRFALPQFRDELPHCSLIMDQIRKPELLYIIGLFHDIAKGRGGDHSEMGAELAITFCENHGFNKHDTQLVQWVVRHHLIMSMTAQRRDISDPEVVNEFAQQVGSRENLNHLYLLTVADIRATNPELWNAWKESLLRGLFKYTSRALHRGLDSLVDKDEAIAQKKQDVEQLLAQQTRMYDPVTTTALWEKLGEEYFLRYFPDEVAWHCSAILAHSGNAPLIKLRRDNDRGSTEILVYVHDHAHLFALLVSELDRLGLNILAANVGTTADDYALNTFIVLEYDNTTIADAARIQQIKDGLYNCLANPDTLPDILQQKVPRRLRHFQFEPKITIDNEISDRFTSIYIEAADRPGILSRIGRCFLSCDILVHSAKVTTLGEKIEDVFFVTDQQGQQLHDDGLLFALHDCFIQRMSDDEDV